MGEVERLAKAAHWYNSKRDFDFHLINFGTDLILKNASTGSGLELGCASGVMTQRIAAHFKNLVVVDGSSEYIDQTKRGIKRTNVEYVVSLFEHFEPSRRFNDIIMADILEHIKKPVYLLKRARGWLASGGRIHIIVPNARSLHRRVGVALKMLDRLTDLSERDHQIGHRRVYTRELLFQHIQQAGLKVVRWEGIFLKALSNQQLEGWDERLIGAFYRVGKEIPEWCATIYVVCKKT